MATSPKPLPIVLPDESRLKLEDIEHVGDLVVLVASAIAEGVRCPICGVYSEQVHSRYCRTLKDLPAQSLRVHVRLRTRRFYCRCRSCKRRIFTERFPTLAPTYARQTTRHQLALKVIAYALGGEAGARLAHQLGIQYSADSMLRILKQLPVICDNKTPRVLGVDDWAWKKGHRYGTVLVDLEKRRAVDLLPDRESKTVTNWLNQHPGVEIITRDRAGAYAEAAAKGAPDALQIADRFHILCNLTQALRRVLERFAGSLQRLRLVETDAENPLNVSDGRNCPNLRDAVEVDSDLNRHEQLSVQRRDARKARYDAVHAASKEGLNISQIARRLSLTHKTVRRFLSAQEFPERAPRKRRSALDPFHEYLRKRWAEGCHNASQLCRELRQQGYAGQRSRVKEYLHPWRSQSTPPRHPHKRRLPNLKLVAFWLSKPTQVRSAEEQRWTRAVTADNVQIAQAEALALQFRELLQARDPARLDAWLHTAETSCIPEMKTFANGVYRDYNAVRAGIQHSWSNGPVEGQVHRLKLLKRQMYGRAGFHLLRIRVLPLTSAQACHPESP